MTFRNKLYNWLHGVKRYRKKGCINCGKYGDKIVKYDWFKPLIFTSKKY